MQRNEITKKLSELEIIGKDPERITSSLANVFDQFKLRSHFSMFDFLKSKGIAVSSLLTILVILPFYGVANVYDLIKSGINSSRFEGQKDVYYDIKNNEYIDWRTLLLLHAKRFRYLVTKNVNLIGMGVTAIIFDDSLLEKTGRKTEKVSRVNDHVSGRFVFGYKLLVCGFWDGSGFIPLDFSLHREKGKKQEKLIKEHKKATNLLANAKDFLEKCKEILQRKQKSMSRHQQVYLQHSTKTNKTKFENAESSYREAEKILDQAQVDLHKKECSLKNAKKAIRNYYQKNKLFGLTVKERQEQYRKTVKKDSFGYTRRKEADIDKITSMIKMLGRVVKNGFVADFVLTDSWFFCFALLDKLSKLRNGSIKLISMVKMSNRLFTVCETGKDIPANQMPKRFKKDKTRCRKLKSEYIKVDCNYKGIRTNLFFVKMGKSDTWHLLLTTDLSMNFIKLMEVYQIRWSIEVFFKESKQFLNLGMCKSSNFDAQIGDTTITMIQHIMLSYYKRLNYQKTIGNLFKDLKKELVELDLFTKLLAVFMELVQILCRCAGVDFILFQKDLLQNDEFMGEFINLFPVRPDIAA